MASGYLAVLLALADCSGSQARDGVIRPIASGQVRTSLTVREVQGAISSFASRERFAELRQIEHPQGQLSFASKLYRDDISIVVAARVGEPIQIFAYATCACETSHQADLAAQAKLDLTRLQSSLSAR